jgi:deaminated glutathione amidase
MRVAALQTVSTPVLEENLGAASKLLEQAAAQGAELAVLPEYFCLMGQRDEDKLGIAEHLGQGPIQALLSAAARRHGLWLVGGTLPLVVPGRSDRVFNTTLVYSPEGQLAARYDKLHLFAFDNGRERYDEGRVLQAGSAPQAVLCGPLRVGLSICYDLRFPELYRAMMVPPLDAICVPAAFTHTTGAKHWELLLRARAVENQCYVIASAQGGTHTNGRRTWGHSMVIDPWGEVLAVQAEGPGVVVAEVQASRIEQVRMQLPALKHRRL